MRGTTLPDAPYPPEGRGWWLVAVLVLAYAVSFVDRQILGLLVEDLRHGLAITDSQIGLLQGPAFGVFYAVMGMPFGWLADRTDRVRLIAAGLLLWTGMTLLGGLSDSFGMLFATRVGVGVGEAALVPAAVSLLSDSFAPERRSLPLAVFTAGVSIGAGLALMLGGALVAFARHGIDAVPLIGVWFAGRAPWQTVLILAGALGVPVALLVLTLPGPARRQLARTDGDDSLLHHLARHKSLFVPLLAGSSLLYLFSNAYSAWVPSLFVRGFGWTPAFVGLRLGSLILSGALVGTLASGVLATALVARGRANGTLMTMVIGSILLVPLAIGGALATDPTMAQAGVSLTYFAIALCFGVATANFVAVTPPSMRGRMVALYLLLGNLVGLGLGPPSVGLLVDHVLHDPARIGAALALVALAVVVPGALLLALASGPHRRLAIGLAGCRITTRPDRSCRR